MRARHLLLTLAASASLASTAQAMELVKNGGFELTPGLTESSEFADYFAGVGAVSDWATTGYNMIYFPGTALTTGATNEYHSPLTFWGPGNGADDNGFAESPVGGKFVGADGAYLTQPITQQIDGLTVGAKYNLTFWWAAAQQHGYTGTQTEAWSASLGNETYFTPIADNASHGFTPWAKQTFTFTATDASETLSFLAHGTPTGVPPFSLLDGVSLTAAVPEPASWALMILGLGGVGLALRRRRATAATA